MELEQYKVEVARLNAEESARTDAVDGLNTQLEAEQQDKERQKVSYEEALAASANKAKEAAASQEALHAHRLLEKDNALAALEETHKAALLSAETASLQLKDALESTQAANAELLAAMEKSAAEAANAAHANASTTKSALEDMQSQLRASKLAKKEADDTKDAAVAARRHAVAEKEAFADQLEEKNTALSRAQSEISQASRTLQAQADETAAVHEKLRKSNAIAMSHKRSLDAAQAAHQLATSEMEATLASRGQEFEQALAEAAQKYASDAEAMQAEARRLLEVERLKFQEKQKAFEAQNEAAAASAAADAAEDARAKSAADFRELRAQQEAEEKQRRDEEVVAARKAAVEAAAVEWQQKLGEVQQFLQCEKERGRAKAKEWEAQAKAWRIKETQWEDDAARLQHHKQGAAVAVAAAPFDDHHVVAMSNAGVPNVRGRSGTALGQTSSFRNSKVAGAFDPELGQAGAAVAPNTASKDKRHRAKPLGEALRSAMLRLPRQVRQGLVVYLAVLHLLLLVLLLGWIRGGGGGGGSDDEVVVNPVVAHG